LTVIDQILFNATVPHHEIVDKVAWITPDFLPPIRSIA